MGMALDEIQLPPPEVELGPSDWFEYLRILGLPPEFLADADPAAFHVLVACLDGKSVAASTALTARHAHDALARGCRTASLQSTWMAERVYAAVGFRDLGRILEYVPRQAPAAS
jgi:hypothetical protein